MESLDTYFLLLQTCLDWKATITQTRGAPLLAVLGEMLAARKQYAPHAIAKSEGYLESGRRALRRLSARSK